MNSNLPLVTLTVITYNSSAYILDTLNSTLGQDYPNIELVISDDCSTDNTCEIIDKWVAQHKDEFVSCKFIKNPVNRGVAHNCNIARRNGTGEWIKALSGDDQLLPWSISGYMDYVMKHPDVQICFGKFQFFSTDSSDNYVRAMENSYTKNFYSKIKLPLWRQKREILKGLFIPGPGIFLSRKLYEQVGGYDENYPFCEEDPIFNRIIAAGYQVHFIDRQLYRYNVRQSSLGQSSKHIHDRMRYFFDERLGRMIRKGVWLHAINDYLQYKSIMASDAGRPRLAKLLTILRRCSPLMIQRYFLRRRNSREWDSYFK